MCRSRFLLLHRAHCAAREESTIIQAFRGMRDSETTIFRNRREGCCVARRTPAYAVQHQQVSSKSKS